MGVVAGPACAQIYAGTTGGGAVVLSNFQTSETPDLVIAAPVVPASAPASMVAAASVTPAPALGSDTLRAEKLKPMIQKVARETSMSAQLLQAVIAVESGYDTKAVSRKGAQGLMQLMPQTALRFGVRDALDPMQNVRAGALYLKWLLDYFDGDLKLALAGYNAGENEVVRAGYRIPAIKETRDYVPKVLARLKNRPLRPAHFFWSASRPIASSTWNSTISSAPLEKRSVAAMRSPATKLWVNEMNAS
jgi:soluble lytic murein transglycosylase-like protein